MLVINLRDGLLDLSLGYCGHESESVIRRQARNIVDALNLVDAATKVGIELLQGAFNAPRTAAQSLWNDALLRILTPSPVKPAEAP